MLLLTLDDDCTVLKRQIVASKLLSEGQTLRNDLDPAAMDDLQSQARLVAVRALIDVALRMTGNGVAHERAERLSSLVRSLRAILEIDEQNQRDEEHPKQRQRQEDQDQPLLMRSHGTAQTTQAVRLHATSGGKASFSTITVHVCGPCGHEATNLSAV